MICSHYLNLCQDGVHLLLGQSCRYVIHCFQIFQNGIDIAKPLPHQRPGISHPRLLVGPCVVMQTDMVTTIITMTALLRQSCLIGRPFAMEVMAILPCRSQPSLHVSERPYDPLHNFYLVVVEVIFVKLTIYGFIKVCTANSGKYGQGSKQTCNLIFV